MRLIDSSAWVEFLGGSKFGLALGNEFPSNNEWLVPTIVQLELAKWLAREISEDKADRLIAFTGTCVLAPLTTSIALEAAVCCAQYRLATADAIIYATAKVYSAELLTCDKHFDGLPGVKFIRKPG
jgi:predicted nucleic acid-binding protein